MLNIYLVRHGETEWNKAGKMQGHLDSELSDLGKKQAGYLSEKLKDIKFEGIYSSTSTRAFNTAKILKGDRNIEVKAYPELREFAFGKWEGMHIDDVKETYPKEYENFWNNPQLYDNKEIGGENFETVSNRLVTKFKEISLKHKDGNILIVSHGVSIKLIISYLNKLPLEKIWKTYVVEKTGLSLIEFDGNKYNILMVGDTSHYKKED